MINNLEKSIDPKNYFSENDFESSQLISISFNESEKLLSIALRYARTQEFIDWLQGKKKPDSPISDFRLLVFKGVQKLNAKGLWIKKNEQLLYSSKNSGQYLIDFIDLNAETQLKILINLTSSSEIEFVFESFYVKRKLGYAIKKQNENEWDYYDVKSHRRFDFFNPFNLSADLTESFE